MSDPVSSTLIKVTISEVFKQLWKSGAEGIPPWIKEQLAKADPFGSEAKKYTSFVRRKYDVMRILGMSTPVELSGIFINVRIHSELSSSNRKSLTELEMLQLSEKNICNGQILGGKELVKKNAFSMVLGKPGAGKTTFLKHLALLAIKGELHKPIVPIFIPLKDWIDSKLKLEDYIIQQFSDCELSDSKVFVTQLLIKGNCLLLLDGLDEVGDDSDKVRRSVDRLVNKYNENIYIVSCRISANRHLYERFSEVEMADFNDDQIKAFMKKWFNNDQHSGDVVYSELQQDENSRIKELAKSPLLLTLICLAYRETMSFPLNKSELYKEALDALLKKWDSSRSIKRDELYKNLTLQKKELLFSKIALTYFVEEKIFFRELDLVKEIDDFMSNLIPDQYQGNGDMVLKSIESQHGLLVERAHKIYSFSHLTFHEYFAAKCISESANPKVQHNLISKYLFDRRWVEILIMVSYMLPDADEYLLSIRDMISKIDLHRSSRVMFEAADKVIHENVNYPRPILRAIGLRYLLSRLSTETYSPQLREGLQLIEQLIGELSSSYKLYVDNDIAEIETLKLGLSDSRKQIDDIVENLLNKFLVDDSKNFLNGFSKYLFSTQIFIKCILSDCYIDRSLRRKLIDSFIVEPWVAPNTAKPLLDRLF